MLLRTSKIAALFLSTTMILFAGCGRGSADPQRFSQVDAEPVTSQKLLGVWNTGCLPAERGLSHGAASRLFRVQFDFSGVATLKEYAYIDGFCRTRMFDNTGDGRFQVTNQGRKVSFNFNTQFVTPFSDQGAAIMNQGRFCESTTWRARVSRDIRNAPCVRTNSSTANAGLRETGELILDLCATRVTSSLACEQLFFGYEGHGGQGSSLDIFND